MYLILEICHNGELNRYLKTKRRTLTENEGIYTCSSVYFILMSLHILARRILTQVVEGLIYLHSHNIIHRDLSLANLLLTTNMDAVSLYFIYIIMYYILLILTENSRFWFSHST